MTIRGTPELTARETPEVTVGGTPELTIEGMLGDSFLGGVVARASRAVCLLADEISFGQPSSESTELGFSRRIIVFLCENDCSRQSLVFLCGTGRLWTVPCV